MNNTEKSNSIEDSLLLLLKIAKEADIQCLTKTELVKYLYLLDVYVACEQSGTKWTDVEWKFLHFGPFSPQVSIAIEGLTAKSFINETAISSQDREGYLYRLSDWKIPKSFEELGISNSVFSKMNELIRRFRDDLYSLLQFTYFETPPMRDAVPEQLLTFEDCVKYNFKSFLPVKMKQLDNNKLAVARQKIKQLLSKQPAKHSISWEGKFDEIYYDSMKYFETGSEISSGISGKIHL